MAEQLAQGDERPELRLGHGPRTVLIAGLVGALVGGGVAWHSSQDPDPYTSTTTVAVRTPGGAAATTSVNMDNELQVITSDKVADAAKALLRVDTETDVLERQLTATVPANTSVIDVSFSASTPEKAIAGSHAFALAYLNYRTDQAKSQIAVLSEVLGTQLAALQASVAKYAGQAAATTPSVDRAAQLRPHPARHPQDQRATCRPAGPLSRGPDRRRDHPGSVAPDRARSPQPERLLAVGPRDWTARRASHHTHPQEPERCEERDSQSCLTHLQPLGVCEQMCRLVRFWGRVITSVRRAGATPRHQGRAE